MTSSPMFSLHLDNTSVAVPIRFSLDRALEHAQCCGIVLGASPSAWDLAPLVDVIGLVPGAEVEEFTGATVARLHRHLSARAPEAASKLRSACERFVAHSGDLSSVIKRVNTHRERAWSIELPMPEVASFLLQSIAHRGPAKARPEQWIGFIRGLQLKGMGEEEIEQSLLMPILSSRAASEVLSRQQVVRLARLRRVAPVLMTEGVLDLQTTAGFDECCRSLTHARRRKARLRLGASEARFVVRYFHRVFGYEIVFVRYRDILESDARFWVVLDERGRLVARPHNNYDSAGRAMQAALSDIRSRWWKDFAKVHAQSKYAEYREPGGSRYQEFVIAVPEHLPTFRSGHFSARNIVAHVRTTLRSTSDGRTVLFLEEVQSDWHAHFAKHKRAACAGQDPQPPPFRKDWIRLAIKLMLWWAQRQGVSGMAWSTVEMQERRWFGWKVPLLIYRSELPKAAAGLAQALGFRLESTSILVRSLRHRVSDSERCSGKWDVLGSEDVPVTRPFDTRQQAEHFADLTCCRQQMQVPVIWLDAARPIGEIPLFGTRLLSGWTGCSGTG